MLTFLSKGDQGSAVTSFVTEYRARKESHASPFTIRVKCSGIEHIKEQLDDLLYDIRAFDDPGILDSVSEGSDEFRALQRKSEVALSTIESIFPQSEESSLDYLLEREARTVDDIKAALHALADRISWPTGAETGQCEFTAETAYDCRNIVSQFMENGLWPLIDKVE